MEVINIINIQIFENSFRLAITIVILSSINAMFNFNKAFSLRRKLSQPLRKFLPY